MMAKDQNNVISFKLGHCFVNDTRT